MNAAVVKVLHPMAGPWEVATLRELVHACREIADRAESVADAPETLNDDSTAQLAAAFREIGHAFTDEARRGLELEHNSTTKRPVVQLSERLAQGGRAVSLFTIDYLDGRPCDAFVTFQQGPPSAGGSAIRVVEMYQGPDTAPPALERARRAYERAQGHLLNADG